jgi:hypothetical protein
VGGVEDGNDKGNSRSKDKDEIQGSFASLRMTGFLLLHTFRKTALSRALKPAFGASDAGGVGAVGGSQFGDGF